MVGTSQNKNIGNRGKETFDMLGLPIKIKTVQ